MQRRPHSEASPVEIRITEPRRALKVCFSGFAPRWGEPASFHPNGAKIRGRFFQKYKKNCVDPAATSSNAPEYGRPAVYTGPQPLSASLLFYHREEQSSDATRRPYERLDCFASRAMTIK